MSSFGIIGGGNFGAFSNRGMSMTSGPRRTKRVPGDPVSKTAGRMGGKNFHNTGATQPIGPKAPEMGRPTNFSDGLRTNQPLAMRGGDYMKATHKTLGKGKSKSAPKRNFRNGGGGGGGNRNSYVPYHGEPTGRSPGPAGTFESKVASNAISTAMLPTVGTDMGTGAHLQVLDLPTQEYSDSRLYVKNVSVTPTGLNKPTSEVYNYFTNYVYPAYINLLQTNVNYKIDVPVTQFQQWFFNLQSALHLWFHVNKIITAYDSQPALNRGINHLREQLTAEELNLYDNLTKMLSTKVMDPKMVSFIRWMHDLYTTSPTNPNAEILMFSYDNVILGDNIQTLLQEAITNMSNVDLIKVNSLMLKARPNWMISLSNYSGQPKYDEQFYTYWANTPENYLDLENDNQEYIKPYVFSETEGYRDRAHFNIYGNEYSPLLHGLTCFHKSADGKVDPASATQGIYYGFVTPAYLTTRIPTSYVRYDSVNEQFVPAGYAQGGQLRTAALMASPSASTILFDYNSTTGQYTLVDNWPFSCLKPQCQEPISMSISTARQDFNIGMRDLFSWSTLIRSDA